MLGQSPSAAPSFPLLPGAGEALGLYWAEFGRSRHRGRAAGARIPLEKERVGPTVVLGFLPQ